SNMVEAVASFDDFAGGIESLAEREGEIQSFQYELLLEARRRPELGELAARHYNAYRDAIIAQLGRLGAHDPERAGLIWFALDGIVFKQLVAPGDAAPALRRVRALVAQAAN